MPRWWPGVTRMEGVEPDRFTQVFMTKKGRAVRADHFVIEAQPPGPDPDAAGVFSWSQEIEGTPFERVLTESVTEVQLEGDDVGTLVTIVQIQKLRGLLPYRRLHASPGHPAASRRGVGRAGPGGLRASGPPVGRSGLREPGQVALEHDRARRLRIGLCLERDDQMVIVGSVGGQPSLGLELARLADARADKPESVRVRGRVVDPHGVGIVGLIRRHVGGNDRHGLGGSGLQDLRHSLCRSAGGSVQIRPGPRSWPTARSCRG